jgi:cell division protein ZipA
MEFGLREYLLILGTLLIVGLLADGIRRTIKHKRQGLKLDLMAAPPASPETTDVSPKRPVKRATAAELEPQVNTDPLFDSDDQSQLNLWAGEIRPETMKGSDVEPPDATDALFDEDDPTDSVFETPETAGSGTQSNRSDDDLEPPISAARYEPTLDERNDPVETPEASDANEASHAEDMRVLTEGPMDAPMPSASESRGLGAMMSRMLGRLTHPQDVESAPEPTQTAMPESEPDTGSEPTDRTETAPDMDETAVLDDLVLVQLMPTRADRFVDVDLHRAALRAGLRRTPQNWYQRYPLDQASTPLYSLVNGVEPGVFEQDAHGLNTPMLVLFTELARQPDPVFAVNELIAGARAIAREIGGDVFDTDGQPISKEWIDVARARAGQARLMQS